MKKNKILVVEDDESILFNIKLLLEFNNFDVVTASNGREASELISFLSPVPDLIVSDIMMPEMNGYDFIKVVITDPNWSNIPFLFLSAKASPEDINLGKKMGANDYITKPLNEEHFLSVIRKKIWDSQLLKTKLN